MWSGTGFKCVLDTTALTLGNMKLPVSYWFIWMILCFCLPDRLSIHPQHPVNPRNEGRWLMRTWAWGDPGCKQSSRRYVQPLQNTTSPQARAGRQIVCGTMQAAARLPSWLHHMQKEMRCYVPKQPHGPRLPSQARLPQPQSSWNQCLYLLVPFLPSKHF